MRKNQLREGHYWNGYCWVVKAHPREIVHAPLAQIPPEEPPTDVPAGELVSTADTYDDLAASVSAEVPESPPAELVAIVPLSAIDDTEERPSEAGVLVEGESSPHERVGDKVVISEETRARLRRELGMKDE